MEQTAVYNSAAGAYATDRLTIYRCRPFEANMSGAAPVDLITHSSVCYYNNKGHGPAVGSVREIVVHDVEPVDETRMPDLGGVPGRRSLRVAIQEAMATHYNIPAQRVRVEMSAVAS